MSTNLRKKLTFLSIITIGLFAALFVIAPVLVERSMNRVTASSVESPSPQALSLHSRLWISDLHSDALLWNRNLLERGQRGHVDIPRLIEGTVALQAFTVVSKTPIGLNYESNDDRSDMITVLAIVQRWPVRAWFSLKERALYQATKLFEVAETSHGKFVVITSKVDLQNYMARREMDQKITAGWLGIEGAQVLEGKLENVEVLFRAGFRMMAPSHFFDTEVGGSAHGVNKGGLSELGKQVIGKMESIGMIVDVAHASPQTIDDVLAIATKPVFVSHTGVKGRCDNIRNLSDRQLRGIAATGGVIGIAFFDGAVCGEDVAAIVRSIRYTVELVGVEHVALGSDFDGTVATPFDAAGMSQLTEGLMRAGFSGQEIALLMGENVKRVLLQTLPD